VHELVEFEERHVPGVLQLIGSVFAEYGLTFEPSGYDADLTRIRDVYLDSGGAFWVLLDGERVVGTVAVVPHSDSGVEIKRVYLDASLRGKGVGRKLVEHAIAWAVERGHTVATLWSDVKFTRAHVMYERLGFVRFGIRDCDDVDQSQEHGYRKALAASSSARS
jgi:GNAT superfamily N-acetyltransferase